MKQDRFERMIEKEYQRWLKGPQVKGWLSIPLILLHREHAAVVRLVKAKRSALANMRAVGIEECTYRVSGLQLYDDLLAALAARRGKRCQ